MISSKTECETAARSLYLSDTSASELEGQNYDRPSGCIVSRVSGWLGWYDVTNDVECGSQDDVNLFTYNCLCKRGKIKNVNTQTLS